MPLLTRRTSWLALFSIVALGLSADLGAATKTPEELTVALDTVWVLLTASLVFFMNLGFALVESGFCRAKNTVNILSKNFIVFAISCLAFYVFGWGLMFGNGSGFVGLGGPASRSAAPTTAPPPATPTPAPTRRSPGPAFRCTRSSSSSSSSPAPPRRSSPGSVAERIKYFSFIVFSFLLVAFVYPITGHWIWGGGWLATAGFWDFAGSTVVHSVGGWAALAGILVLGPRLGKYGAGRQGERRFPAHSMTSGVIGCFVLWLGWFGFNPGSTMAADPNAISHIFMTTNTGGVHGAALGHGAQLAAGTASRISACRSTAASPAWSRSPRPCAFVTVKASLIIGLLAGFIVVCAVKLLDTLKIDDPVGAVPVHLFNGVFGTLCVGLFAVDKITGAATGNGLFNGGGMTLLIAQLKGIVAVAVYTLVASLVFWYAIKAVIGLRVSEEEEEEGLDIGEHGQVAYTGIGKLG